MKDIIEQIIEIDSLAYNNKKRNDEYLKNKRQEYENKIVEYRQSMLQNAKIETEKIISGNSCENQDDFVIGKSVNICTEIEKKYSLIEEDLTKKIFNKLFAT